MQTKLQHIDGFNVDYHNPIPISTHNRNCAPYQYGSVKNFRHDFGVVPVPDAMNRVSTGFKLVKFVRC